MLQYSGKPITLPFECTADDIHFSGMACSEDDPCPIYLELATAEGAGGRIFSAGNIHGEAVTLDSVLLASEDGGHTWSEAFARLRGAALDRIQLLDGSGWVAGQTAFPIAQDPFFLVTADNGATWQRHPIFSESRYGSIVQFAFDSRTSGTAILDLGVDNEGGRYARYETTDGGATWAVKELSVKAPPLKRAPVANSTWRVRADATLHAYRIERRTGERWSTVADFSVKLPACKPQ
jgi:photosystem II stability/assembly factor-like uncharacterized protein